MAGTIVTETREWTRLEIAELLISRTALTELKREAAQDIAQLLKPEHVAAGTVLIEEGVTSTGFMALVLEGEAIVANAITSGEAVVLGEIGPGAVFGEMGILDGKPRSATVTAVTDMDIAVLDRQSLSRLIDEMPGVAVGLLSAVMVRVAERLRATNARVMELVEENRKLRGG
ncbi:Crp/Fnr family transcriptional regulator [Ramlibacter sp. PS4R-6]|uniref:Crp/Fnr family transcriptional regulator n=1 Tax=Ramlibacter sp. PS4R-6 TaxID=3133438 RepID=UPI0030B2CF9F